jgi:hypothetical protein
VFEKAPSLGGVWNYAVPSDLNSKTNPMYRKLRTNLPAELMAFREFPWTYSEADLADPVATATSFPTHCQVQHYLEAYATHFDLRRFVSFNTEVLDLRFPHGASNVVEITTSSSTSTFDVALVANGHYSKPIVPPSLRPLFDAFSSSSSLAAIHSVHYDVPENPLFKEKVVLIVGGRASGSDIAREIKPFASRVYVSDSSPDLQPDPSGKVVPVSRTTGVETSTKYRPAVVLDNKERLEDVDVVVFATGYDYDFPFLHNESVALECVSTERRVSPLYRQLWYAKNPRLAFVGLPHSVVPFPLFELQAEALAETFASNFSNLPSLEDRLSAAAEDKSGGGPKGSLSANGTTSLGRVADTHYLGSAQWDYLRELAVTANVSDSVMASYLRTCSEIYEHTGVCRKQTPIGGDDDYRSFKYVRDTASFATWESAQVPKR